MYSSNDSWQLDRWLTRHPYDQPEAPRCTRCDENDAPLNWEKLCPCCEEEAEQDFESRSEAGNSKRALNE